MPISPIQRYWKSPRFIDEFGWCIPQSWLTDEDSVEMVVHTLGGIIRFSED